MNVGPADAGLFNAHQDVVDVDRRHIREPQTLRGMLLDESFQ
jgi:hypothetical protein